MTNENTLMIFAVMLTYLSKRPKNNEIERI